MRAGLAVITAFALPIFVINAGVSWMLMGAFSLVPAIVYAAISLVSDDSIVADTSAGVCAWLLLMTLVSGVWGWL